MNFRTLFCYILEWLMRMFLGGLIIFAAVLMYLHGASILEIILLTVLAIGIAIAIDNLWTMGLYGLEGRE